MAKVNLFGTKFTAPESFGMGVLFFGLLFVLVPLVFWVIYVATAAAVHTLFQREISFWEFVSAYWLLNVAGWAFFPRKIKTETVAEDE